MVEVFRRGLFLLGLLDEQSSAIRSRDGASYKQQVFLCRDADNAQILDGSGSISELTRHLLALDNISRPLTAADGARLSVPAAAVSVTSALEVMTNHNAVVTFTFGGSRNVKEFARCEDIRFHDRSDFQAASAFRAEFLDHRRRILFQSGLDHRTEYLFRDILDFS